MQSTRELSSSQHAEVYKCEDISELTPIFAHDPSAHSNMLNSSSSNKLIKWGLKFRRDLNE